MTRWLAALAFVTVAYSAPVHLRCEYLDNPLGLDVRLPHLSWQEDNQERNWLQSEYQILVAASAEQLRAGHADVWDSGRRASAESLGIIYAGPVLKSATRYYWTVRTWDASGKMSQAAVPAWWEMGLLTPADWTAKWISRKDPEAETDRAGIRWIAGPNRTAATFRYQLNIAAAPRSAALYLRSPGGFHAKVNGRETGSKDGRFQEFDRQDITELISSGAATIEVSAGAALAGLIRIVNADGSIARIPTGGRWQTADGPATELGDLDDPGFAPSPGPLPGPAAMLRREFVVSKPIHHARLYVTALGSYRAFLNGHRVGSDVLTPEYTDYRKRVTYQTYDVTALLARGGNAIAAMLGDGWFASGSTWLGVRFSFLPPPTRLLAQLQIRYADGSLETIGTGESWKTAPAPVLHSEIYAGEVYDARLEQPGWQNSPFDDSRWTAASLAAAPEASLSGAVTEPARVVATIDPRTITHINDAYIFDMGQNTSGWVKLKATGPAGAKIRLRFAEMLDGNGSLDTANLRSANQTDSFYLRGTGAEETFEPWFTFHGFRYVEVTGYPGTPSLAAITGQVVSSIHAQTGKLTTSSDLVNRMFQAALWSERANFLSIPMDCPQRDERLGWTGDAQIFWRTGAYNADLAAFGHKWMRDLIDDQSDDGAFGNTAPSTPGIGSETGAPGWGDAGVIVPWTAWQQYGDTDLVREAWPAMQTWLDLIASANPNFLRQKKTGANFGDWLAPDDSTPKDLVATAYWARIAEMMRDMAAAIGRPADARRYADLYSKIRAAFQKEHITADAVVGHGSQSSYVLALQMNLVPYSLQQAAVDHLVNDIQAHDGHLTTGFLGTPPLLFVLAGHGRTDVAYQLLLNETYPSWGYIMKQGATTWWERWNGDRTSPEMNSLNHYALGSVVEWMYRDVAGIDTAFDAPGFRRIVIHPRPDSRITEASGEYDSVYGLISSAWSAPREGPFTLKVRIPANTTADVYLPAMPRGEVTIDSKPIHPQRDGADYRIKIGAGSYRFESR